MVPDFPLFATSLFIRDAKFQLGDVPLLGIGVLRYLEANAADPQRRSDASRGLPE